MGLIHTWFIGAPAVEDTYAIDAFRAGIKGETIVTNEKDKELAKQYLKKWGADNHITMYTGLDELVETFADALTTIRKEEREAAFKKLQQDIDDLHAACECGNLDPRDVDRLIEAAATAKKGGNDGPS